MSVKDKLAGFFTSPDEDDDDEVTEVVEEESRPLSKYERKGGKNVATTLPNIAIVEPRNFNEAFNIADKLKAGASVMVNLRKLPALYQQRMTDILQGVTYGLGGRTVKTDQNSILCTPKNISVDGQVAFDGDGDE